MKKIILLAVLICLIAVYAHGVKPTMERKVFWFTDAYEFGKKGNNCSSIYYDYGTPNWTFNADDSEMLKEIHDACEAGKSDKVNGLNSLPEIIEGLHNGK